MNSVSYMKFSILHADEIYYIIPLKMIKKGLTKFLQMCITGRRRYGGPHKVYIFTRRITSRVN